MLNRFLLWLSSFFCLWFFPTTGNTSLSKCSISGEVFKIEYKVPSFIANPPFGWYMKLDASSQKKLRTFYAGLIDKYREFYGEFDFSIVRLCSVPIKLTEGMRESFNGNFGGRISLDGPDCFDFDVAYEERFGLRDVAEESEFYPSLFSDKEFPWISDVQEKQEVELTGILKFQIFPGPANGCSIEGGDSVEQCWYVVVESAQVPYKWHFPDLRGEKICIGWVKDENLIDKKVVVRGALFNAHTSHHHTSLLMDMKSIKWWDSQNLDQSNVLNAYAH